MSGHNWFRNKKAPSDAWRSRSAVLSISVYFVPPHSTRASHMLQKIWYKFHGKLNKHTKKTTNHKITKPSLTRKTGFWSNIQSWPWWQSHYNLVTVSQSQNGITISHIKWWIQKPLIIDCIIHIIYIYTFQKPYLPKVWLKSEFPLMVLANPNQTCYIISPFYESLGTNQTVSEH